MTEVAEAGHPLIVEDSGSVRRIFFNRPHVHNAQNVAMLNLLQATLEDTRKTRDIRVLVLAGKGPSFCSGHDLKEMASNAEYSANAASAEGRYRQELDLFVGPIAQLRELDIPTICAVHGHCLAAGLMFVASCDLVIAREDAVFASRIISALAVNEAEVPGLAWVIGERRAKQALWLGEQIDATRAREYGLVNWVVSKQEFEAKIAEVANALALQPREAIALSKASFRFQMASQGRELAAAYHFMAHQLSHQTSEAQSLLRTRLDRVARGQSVVSDEHRGRTDER